MSLAEPVSPGAPASVDKGPVVLGGVDAEGGVVDDADEDGVAGLEDAELLELFGFFEVGLGNLGMAVV